MAEIGFLTRWYEKKQLAKVRKIGCDTINLRSVRAPHYLFARANTAQHLKDLHCLFHLVRYFRPKDVLEIGTFQGASAYAMACAMDLNGNGHSLTTVDINIDHIDHTIGERFPWIIFIKDDSVNYLINCPYLFDLIFLDGDHSARNVYQELALSLRSIEMHGVIVLHDYFPNGKPIPGPYLALKRLCSENKELVVIPLKSVFDSDMALVLRK